MTKDQVLLLLGSPILRDAFHTDRWDYTFNTSRGFQPKRKYDKVACAA
ncbi:smpA / OmlA family protein [Neisseria meningitidis NM3222]|nr:smpA / OmlA family protein [Neisseria meningitidis NM3222]